MTSGITHSDYPPTFILFFELLTLARPEIAYWIWTGLNLLILLAAVAVLLNELAIDGHIFVTFAALAILYEPVSENFFWSQAQIVLLLLLALNLRWVRSGNDAAAGIANHRIQLYRGRERRRALARLWQSTRAQSRGQLSRQAKRSHRRILKRGVTAAKHADR
jgi:hypothetical protein